MRTWFRLVDEADRTKFLDDLLSDIALIFFRQITIRFYYVNIYDFQILKVAVGIFEKLLAFETHTMVNCLKQNLVQNNYQLFYSYFSSYRWCSRMNQLWKVHDKFCSKVLRKKYINLRYYLHIIVIWKKTLIKSHMNAHVPFTDLKSCIKLRKFYFKFFFHFRNGFLIRHFLISTLRQY